jgi:hypothetical protein
MVLTGHELPTQDARVWTIISGTGYMVPYTHAGGGYAGRGSPPGVGKKVLVIDLARAAGSGTNDQWWACSAIQFLLILMSFLEHL